MSSMFKNATSFNSPVYTIRVGHVTDMSSMFEGATNFNYSLRDWNVSNVTDMSSMFKGATSFNQTSAIGIRVMLPICLPCLKELPVLTRIFNRGTPPM